MNCTKTKEITTNEKLSDYLLACVGDFDSKFCIVLQNEVNVIAF